MIKNEDNYIKRINELEAMVAEYDSVIIAAQSTIDGLNLRLALAESGFSKEKLKAKYIRDLELEVSQLRELADFFDVGEFCSKKDEISEFISSIIKIRKRLDIIEHRGASSDAEMFDIESDLADIAQEILVRFVALNTAISNLNAKKHQLSSENIEAYVESINNSVLILREILVIRKDQVTQLTVENEALKRDMLEITDGKRTMADMQALVERQAKEIDMYKNKIKTLEFELDNK